MMFRSSAAACSLLFCFALAGAQTLSNCRPAPPMPIKGNPGVVGLSLSGDGKTLVVANTDGKIRFINLTTGAVEKILSGHTNAVYIGVFSTDEKLLASSSRDGSARVWDLRTSSQIKQFEGFRCAVKAVAFSPNDRLLAASGNDGMLKIWDIKTGKELQSLVHKNSADIDIGTYSFVFARDGKTILAANGDGTISEWDVVSGKETRNWRAHKSGVFKIKFSSDHRVLASLGFTDSVVKLWDPQTVREVAVFEISRDAGAAPLTSAIALSRDGKWIAESEAAFDSKNSYLYVQATVWNVATGQKVFSTRDHRFDINGLLFTRDDRLLITGSVDGTIKFWDLRTGKLIRTISLTR